MGANTLASGQSGRKRIGGDISDLASALRRASEDAPAPTSAALRHDLVDRIYEEMLSASASQGALEEACKRFVIDGLPEDPALADSIVRELLQRFEAARSDILGDVGASIMQDIAIRYRTGFESLVEFHDAAKAPVELVADWHKEYVDGLLSAYDARVEPLKKEYQELAKSLGKDLSDKTLARLSISEIYEMVGAYLCEASEPDSRERAALYMRMTRGGKKDSRNAMRLIAATPDMHKDSWDAYNALSDRTNAPTRIAADGIADFIKKADSTHAMADMLAFALWKIGKDHYLALELVGRLAPDEIDGYMVMGEHVNSISEALNSRKPARVFKMKRKLFAMMARRLPGGAPKAAP